MKFKKDDKKKKVSEDKGTIVEYFYMIPAEVTVRDLMEIVLSADSLIFENMMDTFTEPGDQEFLAAKGVKVVYAASYNTKDKDMVKKVLVELHAAFGGFMASDTEDLEPIFEIADF